MWVAIRNRENQKQPAFCGPGSNKFGNFYPLRQSTRQLAMYDPKTQEWQHIDTCFSADHNQIGEDNFIYFGIGSAIAWVDISTWDKTQRSNRFGQGSPDRLWCVFHHHQSERWQSLGIRNWARRQATGADREGVEPARELPHRVL